MWWRELGKRVAVLGLTVAVVLAVAGAAPTVLQSDDEPATLETPEYDPGVVALDPIAATGTVEPDPDASADEEGTVLIDRGHGNRFARADVEALVDALVRQGYRVEFYTSGDLATHLEDADAFLVIDPGTEYPPGDVDDVRQFTGNGGRLVMVGEPDRTEIVSAGFFGASLQRQESRLTTLASSYGMSVDTQYLYNQEHADGTFKHVLARSTGEGDLDDVKETALYTAAAVTARDGTVVLRSAPNTHKSGSDEVTGEYPVAVRKGNTLLLGDGTFMRGDRYRVADNEHLVAYVAEFMIEGDYRPPADGGADADDDEESDGNGGDAGAEDGESATATAAPAD
jgi:hypothetical protein